MTLPAFSLTCHFDDRRRVVEGFARINLFLLRLFEIHWLHISLVFYSSVLQQVAIQRGPPLFNPSVTLWQLPLKSGAARWHKRSAVTDEFSWGELWALIKINLDINSKISYEDFSSPLYSRREYRGGGPLAVEELFVHIKQCTYNKQYLYPSPLRGAPLKKFRGAL